MSDLQICVAMCTYNGSTFVREQLDSIAAQSRLPDRMVIVDDRSTDSTVSILRSFAAEAPFPVQVVVNETNLGCTGNFDRAIRLSVGDVVVLSDQDDVWVPEKLAVLEDAFRRSPGVGMVFSDAWLTDSGLQSLGDRLWEVLGFTAARQRAFRRGEAFTELLEDNYFVTGATMAFRGEFGGLISPIPDGTPHDGWIALLIAGVAQVEFIREPLIRYRQHASNQVGARRMGWLQVLNRRRSRGRSAVRARYRQIAALRERLHGRGDVGDERLEAVDRVVAHLVVRSGLPQNRLARVPSIMGEFVRRRYRGPFFGLRSCLADLVM